MEDTELRLEQVALSDTNDILLGLAIPTVQTSTHSTQYQQLHRSAALMLLGEA